jgi:hypothetical protein
MNKGDECEMIISVGQRRYLLPGKHRAVIVIDVFLTPAHPLKCVAS